jgi:hypothetical protein
MRYQSLQLQKVFESLFHLDTAFRFSVFNQRTTRCSSANGAKSQYQKQTRTKSSKEARHCATETHAQETSNRTKGARFYAQETTIRTWKARLDARETSIKTCKARFCYAQNFSEAPCWWEAHPAKTYRETCKPTLS